MRIIDWGALDPLSRQAAIARPLAERNAELTGAVRAIIDDVRARGDTALFELTERFDRCRLPALRVAPSEFDAVVRAADAGVRAAMESAIERVRRFHQAQLPQRLSIATEPGVLCEYLVRPIRRVGLYAPAGSAPLPSTVWMLAVPAMLAGCEDIVLATPPRADGTADPLILLAAYLCGIDHVIKVGGAQAVAAMAYGTQRVPRCNKIFGPGNAWVTQAKLDIASDPNGAAIDLPAGPSEVMVIADDNADPVVVAADLLAQAEHGIDSQVILLSPCAEFVDAVAGECDRQAKRLPRADIARAALEHSRAIRVRDLGEAVDIANLYAPEHLIVQTRHPRELLPRIMNAGSIFLGPWSPETVGDYCAGPNHVLPTSGFAHAFSGLGVASFQRRVSVQELSADGLRRIGPEAAKLARAERLEAHALAVDLRLAKLDGDTAQRNMAA